VAANQPFDSRHPAILLVLKGIARTRVELPTQTAPLRSAIIAAIIADLTSVPRDCRDSAILAIGYCFALRRSELAGLDLGHLGTGSGVLVVSPTAMKIHLAHSKAQDGDPKFFIVPRAHNQIAFAAIEHWIALANIQDGQPISSPGSQVWTHWKRAPRSTVCRLGR
jgi:site-specific recombinase XerC